MTEIVSPLLENYWFILNILIFMGKHISFTILRFIKSVTVRITPKNKTI